MREPQAQKNVIIGEIDESEFTDKISISSSISFLLFENAAERNREKNGFEDTVALKSSWRIRMMMSPLLRFAQSVQKIPKRVFL